MSIKLRSKKLKDGSTSLYLDIYHRGKRDYEFIGLKIPKNKQNRKQILELAEKIRSKKELEIYANAYNIPNTFNGKEDFLEFYEKNCKDESYKSSLNKLKEFCKEKLNSNRLYFHRVDEKFCEDYKDWLLTKIGNNTTWVYIYKLKAVCNKAVKQKLLNSNPARYVQY